MNTKQLQQALLALACFDYNRSDLSQAFNISKNSLSYYIKKFIFQINLNEHGGKRYSSFSNDERNFIDKYVQHYIESKEGMVSRTDIVLHLGL